MRIEQSKVKIIISKKEYETLMAAYQVLIDMKDELYSEGLDDLEFYGEISSLEESFDMLECNFEETEYGDYKMEVN